MFCNLNVVVVVCFHLCVHAFPARCTGGGSGGSILIDAATVKGVGLLQSVGGAGAGGCSTIYTGGSGSGGRIAFHANSNGFLGTAAACGASATSSSVTNVFIFWLPQLLYLYAFF